MTRTQTPADPDTSGALVSPQRRNFVFLAIVLGMLLAALDQTIVATALPTIVADLAGAGHQPNFEGRPDRAQVEAALNRIAHRIVAQRDWHEERPRSITAAGEAPGQTVSL